LIGYTTIVTGLLVGLGTFNIFEESIPTCNSPAGKRASAKRRGNKIKSTNDKEINLEIRQHGVDNVHIIQDTNP
jgi:hypothetical protein